MRWPWKRPIVEHRSSLTDAVVSAILQSASGGGVRPALATAALETVATLYASALSACAVSGPSSVTRALDATWRAATASELIRRGQCVYIIGADPVDGLSLAPAASWDVHGGALPASWVYRVQLAGPSGTAWETRVSGEVLHLRWLSDPASPWAGVSPLQRAVDTASLSGWLDKRLAEEASGPVGAFLPVAKYDANPDADLDADDADDPLAALRRDIGGSEGPNAPRSSPKWRRRILRPVRPRKDFVVQRFGANPPRHLVELREQVTRDVGASCGDPARPTRLLGIGQASREAWRQFVSTSVDGLCRRLEAQLLDQLGVEVAIDSAPLGGRDLLARGATVFRDWSRRACPLPTRGTRPGSERVTFPDGKLGPDPAYYNPENFRPPSGLRQAAWLANQRRRTTAEQKRERRRLYMRRRRALGLDTATRRTRDRARVAERVNAGLCRCGRVPRPGRRRCAQCAAEHTRKRERARAGGLCVRCLRGPPLGDRAVCKRCRDRYETRRLSLKIGRARARQYDTDRQRVQRRLEAGQCPKCTAKIAVGRVKCADCLADQRAANRARKAKWLAVWACTKCGRAREDPARLQCAHCRTQTRRYKARYLADGLCPCGGFRAPGRKACAVCLTSHAAAASGRETKRIAARVKQRSDYMLGVNTTCSGLTD